MKSLISMNGVGKYYGMGDTRVNALKTLDLTIDFGEFTSISGPSGSGKSTLLNICGLIDELDEGQYFWAGMDVSNMSSRQRTLVRREKIGFIFQSFNLVPVMSTYENIEYPLFLLGIAKKKRRDMVTEILEQVELQDHANKRPDQLSGGQRQRVAVARALVKKPALIIADEPTANLDTVTAKRVIDLMKRLGTDNNITFLIATHDERMTSRCNRNLHLVDGSLQ